MKLPKSNLEWLQSGTVFLARHGSHAYGTNTPTSDEDFKGVAIPPAKYFHGYLDRFEQAEFHHQKDGLDLVLYDIRKFFKLAADCNPSIIEVLFTDPSDHMIVTPLGQKMLEHRDWFVSKKAKHTFSGYAVSQLKRIRGHNRWLKNPPKAPPTREEFGLPERAVIPKDQLQAAQSMIRKQIEDWNVPIDELDPAAKIAVQERFVEALALIESGYKGQVADTLRTVRRHEFGDDWSFTPEGMGFSMGIDAIQRMPGANLERIAGTLLGFSDNFLELLDKERLFRGRQEEWRQYQEWLKNRNPARAELEARYGYDCKHGMHLVRLLRMGKEILMGKGVLVKRPDAEELLAIRNGAWSFEELVGWADQQNLELDELYRASTAIPGAPDRTRLDALCQELVESSLNQSTSL